VKKLSTTKRLLSCGDEMSNVCFNLAQNEKQLPPVRELMRELCSNWDYFRRVLKAEQRRPRQTLERKTKAVKR
jgi:hypothetical protein